MTHQFHDAAIYLLKECFNGIPEGKSGTWFVEGKEGLLNGLASIDAERASMKPTDRCSSIAGHADHILYTLRGANGWHGGAQPEGTWNDSWKKQDVTPEEWDALRASIQSEYEQYLSWYAANGDWSREDIVIGTLALLPHMAFHLGAVQQLLRIV